MATMAELFVKLHAEWKARDFDEHQDSLHVFLMGRDLIGDGDGQINFLQYWSCRPNDIPETSVTNYAIMDFGDGSMAIRRNHERGEERRWLVAV